MLKRKGFSLAEIMVVIAIISMIAAIAIPALLRSRHNANELSAITSVRTMFYSLQQYYTGNMPHIYPDTLAQLAEPLANPPYIDSVLAGGVKQGYQFTYTPTEDRLSFTLGASPTAVNLTGTRYFYVDRNGVIRANSSGPAGPGSTPIE